MLHPFEFMAVFFSYLAFLSQILCEICCISQRRVSHPIAHSLPHEFLVSVYGSQIDGRCTSMTEGIAGDSISICDGTSVLNDGIIPTLGEISYDLQSQWAGQLFTMNRTVTATGLANITLSFQVGSERTEHDRMEIVVFNCPQKRIYTPTVKLFVDTSFRPRAAPFSFLQTSASLQTTSCSHLLKFCVKFAGTTSSQYFSIQFPYQEGSNYVFLGEVAFLNAAGDPCDPRMPEAIAAPSTTRLPATGPTLPMWPDTTTMPLVDGATSAHLQDIITTQKIATTKDSESDSTNQMSTESNNGTNMTRETRTDSSNVAAIVLSIIFTLFVVSIIVSVVVLIIVKLSRRNKLTHRSRSDADGSIHNQVLLDQVHGRDIRQEVNDIARINLDKVLDSDGKSELHLGKIADAMIEWEGKIAEHLCLTPADINDVKAAHPMRLDLQKRKALRIWKQTNGSDATYGNLIKVFERAGYHGYADTVKNICAQMKVDATSEYCHK